MSYAADRLKSKIPDGKRGVGDQGYRDKESTDKIATRNDFDSKPLKRFKERSKARHETFNARLKAFGILSQAFRSTGKHRMPKHKAAFEACCVIGQYELDNGSPLFKL